jgi:hypothetical protein
MRGEVIPAIVAAGGGAAALGAIAVHEHRRDKAMRASRQAYSVIFPVGATPQAAEAALGSIAGIDYRAELVAEVVADETGIRHLLHLPERVVGSVIDHLTASLPGLRADAVESRSTGNVTVGLRITVPMRALLRTEDATQASRALLTGLGALREGERCSLRWAIRPALGDAPVPRDGDSDLDPPTRGASGAAGPRRQARLQRRWAAARPS